MKIYTKTGDDGNTSLFGGDRVPKSGARIHAYGTVDELNALLGLAESFCDTATYAAIIRELQNDCFIIGADLATLISHPHKIRRITPQDTNRLERHIDTLDKDLPELQNFIIPGGNHCGAFLHVARTVCRRAERETRHLQTQEDINPEILKFLNRLGDLLFVLARCVNKETGDDDTPWNPEKTPTHDDPY